MATEAVPTRRSATGRWLIGGVALAVYALLWTFVVLGSDGLMRQLERRDERRALAARLEEEERQNRALRESLEALRRDDAAIEAAVREELDYQRPGEVVLVLGDRDPLGRVARPAPATQVVPPPLAEDAPQVAARKAAVQNSRSTAVPRSKAAARPAAGATATQRGEGRSKKSGSTTSTR